MTQEKEYWKSVTLTSEILIDLEATLLKYCDKLTYSVYTDSADEKVFQTVKALTRWSCPDRSQICILEITGTYKNVVALELTFYRFFFEIPFKGRRPFVSKCQYFNKEIVKSFNKDMEAFGCREEELYSKQFKTSMTRRLCWALFVMVDLLMVIYWLLPKNIKLSEILCNVIDVIRGNNIYVFAAFGLLLLIKTIEYYLIRPLLRATICPTVNFVWGAEKQRYERRARIRHNLFWGVFTALGVSLVASILSPYFKDFIVWIQTLFEPISS